VRVEGGSYDCAMVWKRTDWTRSYGLTLLYECDVIYFGLRAMWISQLGVM